MAVVRKMESSQITGLERPSPGMTVFHATFFPLATSHEIGTLELAAIHVRQCLETPANSPPAEKGMTRSLEQAA